VVSLLFQLDWQKNIDKKLTLYQQMLVCTDSPIIILGAARSGTKMLREMLKLHPLVAGPLYEKERIWCYGNRDKMDASIQVKDLTPEIKKYIQKHFLTESKKNGRKRIVDKSVANTLRLDFVREIFPNSPIVHIVRDGRDATCSIRDRWKRPADFRYILKNRAFPVEEIPFFLKRQIKWYIEKIKSRKKHVNWWGPKFDDIDTLVDNYSMIEVCSLQWMRCTEAALLSLEKLDHDSYIQIKYEDIIFNPIKIMEEICEFLNLPIYSSLRAEFKQYIQSSSLGRWKNDLSQKELKLIMPHIRDTLIKLSYV